MLKKIFIPGWMYSSDYSKIGDGLNVWSEDVNLSAQLKCEYLIGHSMGAAIALRLWLSNREAKLILVNPFIGQKSLIKTGISWVGYFLKVGIYKRGRLGIKYFPKNFIKFIKLSKEDYWKILESVPKEKVLILHGENDIFLCGNEICSRLKKLGLAVTEISEAGHNWHEKFKEEINKIIE